MKKYFIIGTSVTFIIIFNLGYVFHERLMGNFFREEIGNIQRENYIIPVIAVAFIIYIIIQAYLLHIFYSFSKDNYGRGVTKTAIIFGALIGFLWGRITGRND